MAAPIIGNSIPSFNNLHALYRKLYIETLFEKGDPHALSKLDVKKVDLSFITKDDLCWKRDPKGNSFLHLACASGNPELVSALIALAKTLNIKIDSLVNCSNYDGEYPLFMTASRYGIIWDLEGLSAKENPGTLQIVRDIISLGGLLGDAVSMNQWMRFFACSSGMVLKEIVALPQDHLIFGGISPKDLLNEALLFATIPEFLTTMNDVFRDFFEEFTPESVNFVIVKKTELVLFALNHGGDLNAEIVHKGFTPQSPYASAVAIKDVFSLRLYLFNAIRKGNVGCVRKILDEKIEIMGKPFNLARSCDIRSNDSLHIACGHANDHSQELIELLISRGGNPVRPNKMGVTPLRLAELQKIDHYISQGAIEAGKRQLENEPVILGVDLLIKSGNIILKC